MKKIVLRKLIDSEEFRLFTYRTLQDTFRFTVYAYSDKQIYSFEYPRFDLDNLLRKDKDVSQTTWIQYKDFLNWLAKHLKYLRLQSNLPEKHLCSDIVRKI